LDQLRGILYFYAADGTPLGRLSLATTVGIPPYGLRALRGTGAYLGVGHDLSVATLRVVRNPGCPMVDE
jgi:hypothetical protein